jgi:hypothetical protein
MHREIATNALCGDVRVCSRVMIVRTARGTEWRIEGAPRKLALRAELPGARVFDLAATALRNARALGLDAGDRLALALPASWLVNSPAVSRVLRRWALAPQRDAWIALIRAFEGGPDAWEGEREAVLTHVRALGDEEYAIEAISKVLAVLAPEVVPLMPAPARLFALGHDKADVATFGAMVDWFAGAVRDLRAPLAEIGRPFALDAAQVLDRLLWFDSEGHRHFASKTP